LPDPTLAALAAVAGAAWVMALWRFGLTRHPAVIAWQRLARLRGLADRRPLGDRLGGRLPLLRRAQAETDVGRLLAIAGRAESPGGWLLRTVCLAGLTLAGLLLIDELILLQQPELAFPPALALLAAAGVGLLAYLQLRREAVGRQRALGRAVADSLPHLAVMTFHQRVPPSEALLIFARCQRSSDLHRVLTEEVPPSGAGRPTPPRGETVTSSTALNYEQIGQAYGVPMFAALGGAVRRVTERGLSAQDVYTGLARTTYADRLAGARVAAAQAKTLIVIPMGLMIVPVLLLVGAPLVATLGGIFAP
jgi:hypothetical protein